MAVSNVELIVNAVKAINPLRKVQQESKKVENGIRDVNGRLRDAKSRFIGAGQGANQASRAFDGLAKKAAGLAAAYLGLNAAQNAFREGIQRIESERRIQFLAKGYGEVEQLQDAATKAAKRFGTGQTEANRALADVFARLRPVGVGLEDIVSVYNGFNTAARISGSTAVESANAFRQLSQALGSGALRGDEFNSISEQVPGILTAISTETGVAQGQLRKFAAEGGITADVVIRALKRIETEGAAQLEAALGGPAQAIADFQNAAEDVQVALTKNIVPQMAEVFRGLAELIVNLEGPIRFIGGVAADTLNQINSLITQATQPAAFAARRDIEAGLIPTNLVAAFTGDDVRGGAKQLFGEAGLKELEDRAREFSKLRGQGFQETLLQFMQDRLKTMDAANSLTGGATVPAPLKIQQLLNTELDKTKTKAKESKQVIGSLREEKERLSFLEKINAEINSINEAELAGFEAGRQIVEQIDARGAAEIKRGETNLALLQAKIDGRLEEEQLAQKIKAIEESNLNDVQKKKQIAIINQTAALEKQIQAAEKLDQVYESIGSAVSNGIVNALTAAVEGTKSLADVASQTLRQVANILLQFGVNTALGGLSTVGGTGSIFSKLFGGFRASGGTVTGGRSYMVGEKGPELFTPGRTGSIAPSGSFGGANVVVNVDASGTQAQGDQPNAKALGAAIGAAVQAELVKQKRPGGLLS